MVVVLSSLHDGQELVYRFRVPKLARFLAVDNGPRGGCCHGMTAQYHKHSSIGIIFHCHFAYVKFNMFNFDFFKSLPCDKGNLWLSEAY